MPTLTQIEYILAVASNLHFGRAAKECNVSQPSLSAQIQKVEEAMGFIIFDRSKKPVMVTERGKQFIAQAKIIIKEHKKLSLINSTANEISGEFHLGVIPTLSAYIVPLFVESFARHYPKVKLKISELKTEDIIKMLYDDQLDCGLLVTPLYDDLLIERSLFFEPFYVFLSESNPLSKRKFIKETDLEDQQIWLLNEGHCFRDQVLRVCSMTNQNKVLSNVGFESGSLETLMNLVRKGSGYTLVPELATLNMTNKDKVKYLRPFTKPIPTREVSLVHSRSFLKEEIIEALQEEIIKNIPSSLKSIKKGTFEVVDI